MASSASVPTPQLAIRGSEGVFLINGPPSFEVNDTFGRDQNCKVMAFDPTGKQFAYCNSDQVYVIQFPSCETVLQVDRARTIDIVFSPSGRYLATWEVYFTTPKNPGPNPNTHIWDTTTGQCLREYIHRQRDTWQPQWTKDERICAIQASSEIHFYENGDLGQVVNRLHFPKVTCQLSPYGTPPYVAAYIPGAKGAPSAVRLFKYPNFDGAGAIIASKSFYKADRVDMIWNKKGTAVLAIATQDVDSTGESYYGETSVHFLSVAGESSHVTFPKKGPVYSVDWNPNSAEFCAVYGFMPARATLYNLRCEPIHDFGTGPRNCVYFNKQGTILALGGFANLRGHIQVWERKNLKLLSQVQAADSTMFEWSPDGQHYATAVCSPRLRVKNGYKIWHVSGVLLHEFVSEDSTVSIFSILWQSYPPEMYQSLPITKPTTPGIQSNEPQASKEVYRPPGARGQPSQIKMESNEPPQNAQPSNDQSLSKSALKNKKKREAKAKAKQTGSNVQDSRSEEQRAALAMASIVLTEPAPSPAVGVDMETEKKIKALRKKLKQVEKLKEQQSSGKELEKNQLDKLATEDQLREELARLELH